MRDGSHNGFLCCFDSAQNKLFLGDFPRIIKVCTIIDRKNNGGQVWWSIWRSKTLKLSRCWSTLVQTMLLLSDLVSERSWSLGKLAVYLRKYQIWCFCRQDRFVLSEIYTKIGRKNSENPTIFNRAKEGRWRDRRWDSVKTIIWLRQFRFK